MSRTALELSARTVLVHNLAEVLGSLYIVQQDLIRIQMVRKNKPVAPEDSG